MERSSHYLNLIKKIKEQEKITNQFFIDYYKNNADLLIMTSPWRDWITNYGKSRLTKTWLKMYEILTNFPQLWQGFSEINIFLNAELPGNFLLSSYYFLNSKGIKVNWLLSSYYPNVKDDFLVDSHNLFLKYPQNIINGQFLTTNGTVYNNGDMTKLAIVKITASLVNKKLSSINLYTADGAIGNKIGDSSIIDNNPEKLNTKLLYGECLCGLKVLAEKGALIIKFFSMDFDLNFSLFRVVSSRFEDFTLFKPQASQPVNFESYFIAWGYKKDPLLIEILEKKFDSELDLDLTVFYPVSEQIIKKTDQLYNIILEKRIKNMPLYLTNQLAAGDYELPTIDKKYQLVV